MPPLSDRFSTRPETAPDLAMALRRSTAVALIPRTATAGIPADWLRSCGKTQLAVSYADSQWRGRALDLLLWVDASSRASVLSAYVAAATAITGTRSPGDADAVAAGLLAWLAQTSRRWLIVFDDLAEGDLLTGLWPAGPGQVVITAASSRALSRLPEVLVAPVGPFSRREAMSYLVGRLSSDPDQRRGAIDLIEDLDCHPLALAQATATIGSSWMTCVDYREHFSRRAAVLGPAGGDSLPAYAVTWTISIDHADQLQPGGSAHACLAFAALLDGRGVPVTVFTTPSGSSYIGSDRVAPAQAVEHASAALLGLERAGLLSIDRATEPPTVRMSQALQQQVRTATPAEMGDQAAKAAAAALLELWPDDGMRVWYTQTLRSSAEVLRQATGGLLWAAGCHPLLFRAGRSLDEALLTGPAVDYWGELTAVSDRLLGPAHPDSLALVERLASAYIAAGRAAEAVAWYQRITADWARAFGPGHMRTLAARVNLGRVLVTAGLPEDAIAVLASALSDCEHALGTDHPESQNTRDELAAAYRAAGQIGEAIRLYRRTLGDRERDAGPRNPATIATRQKLAAAYLADGRPKDAISQYKRAVADSERSLGADHLDTLRARGSLASAYHLAGRMAIAVQEYEQVHSRSERALGPDNPDTLAAAVSLANGYYDVGRLSDAAALLEDLLARAEHALSPSDPLIRSARESLNAITGPAE
jgi:tetratricopeptide (TPR) repeat protein